MINAPNIQWPQGTAYLDGDKGTDALGRRLVSAAVPEVIDSTQDFEAGIAGTGTWTITTSSPHTGINCIRSAVIGNGGTTDQVFNVPGGVTQLRFWHRVSSEANFDFFRVLVDAAVVFSLSGTANVWAQQTITVTGATTVTFRYTKDGSSSAGLDAAFVDDLEWITSAAIPAVQFHEPLQLDANSRLKVIADQGTSPWVVSGTVTVGSLPEVEIKNDVGNPVPVSGTVAVSNFPASVEVSNDVGNPLPVNGTVTANQGTNPWVVSGTVTVTDGSGPLTVDGTVTADTNFDYPEDSAHASGNPGAFVLAVRNDTPGSMVDANGDYAPLQVDSTGALRTTGSATLSGTGRDDTDDQAAVNTGLITEVSRQYVYDGTNWDRVRSGGVTGMQGVAGAEAHDAAITGNPVLTGGRASIAAPSDVSADGDITRFWATRGGRLRVYNSGRRRIGLYNASLGPTTITNAADGATGGRWWLQNPVGSTVFAAVRRVYFSMTTGSGLLVLTAPIFTVERFTFTGTASGATITPMKRDSSDPNNSVIIRSAATGMTITAGAAGHGFQCPTALATTSATTAGQTWPNVGDEDEYIILRAGEGVVIRQSTAGTLLDTRIANFDIQWEEFNSTDFKVND